MTTSIATGWEEDRCPILNAIFWADDAISPFTIPPRDECPPVVRAEAATTLGQLTQAGKLEWTHLTSLCEVESYEDGVVVVAGEGGLGGDGFVATLKLLDRTLVWLAFFDCSNPFIGVSIVKRIVHARTNLGRCWRFPLDGPAEVSVVDGAECECKTR